MIFKLLCVFLICCPAITYGQDSLDCNFELDSISGIQLVAIPEKGPEFPGGLEEMNNFLINAMELPCSPTCDAGSVYLSFIILTDGTVSNVHIVRAYDQRLGEAAKNAIEKMPKWLPAECNGKQVPVRFTIPVHINLY